MEKHKHVQIMWLKTVHWTQKNKEIADESEIKWEKNEKYTNKKWFLKKEMQK